MRRSTRFHSTAEPGLLFRPAGCLAAIAVAFQPALSFALPSGGVVSGGQAVITPDAVTTTVTQSTSRAVIDWQSFDVSSGERVRFDQPEFGSVALNRIHDNKASAIDGQVTANGQVWFSNPHGMVFGPGAQVNVGGLIATTSDIPNDRFMAGDDRFTIPGDPSAAIVNHGTITVADSGLAGLVARNVVNDGVITARFGRVELASGDTYALDLAGDGLIQIEVTGELGRQLISNAGRIEAEGGIVRLTAAAAHEVVDSLITNSGDIAAAAGQVSVAGRVFDHTGSIDVSGAEGGTVEIAAKNIAQQGRIMANGTSGRGGQVRARFTNAYIDSEGSTVSASSATGAGGRIDLQGTESISHLFASGSYQATGTQGGSITLSAAQSTKLYAARADASGAIGGGTIRIGGGLHGADASVRNSATTIVNPTSVLDASARDSGSGGQVVVWSDSFTKFAGTAKARGGDGGVIEISSKDTLDLGRYSVTDASSPRGQAGMLLLDPKNITISNTGITAGSGISYFEFVDPNADTGSFGGAAPTVLSTGNVVITDTGDDFAATDAGAAYLFNGATGGLISTLRGSTASDQVGSTALTVLTNGNYVIRSPNWDNGATVDAGAVTWCDGTTGCAGVVSAANSLVGTTASDNVGIAVTVLTNGNYVVRSLSWDNGAVGNAGAVTWCDGTAGCTGAVSAANSLVGSTASDSVGSGGIVLLTNGNYVVRSANWDNGAVANAGAVTWCDGTTGCMGAVSAGNSLIGSTANDQVGSTGVTALTNGNYVVLSQNWDNGALNSAGAATWGNGTTGVTGAVSAANSLVGSSVGDGVGLAVTTLTGNGNYVVRWSQWDNGAISTAGAVTWGDGATGITGAVSAANSLVGSTAGDSVGSNGTTALSNGNYVVRSANWDNGAVGNAGAVTWGDGATGVTGAVSAANSLVGSTASDSVGSSNGTALSNGNYVVVSPFWDDGAVSNAGAATLCSGTAGCAGAITSGNSIIGPSATSSLQAIVTDTVNNRWLARFSTAQRVYSASINLSGGGALTDYDSFAEFAAADVDLAPSFITATLNAGTSVTLQASNDITLSNDLIANNPGGNGGVLTFQAGRSILLNASITTDNGNLNLYANEDLSTGVQDANRDAGSAVITMANGTSITAGTGAVVIRLDDGAGKTNAAAGDITLRSITAASVFARNFSSTGDIVLGSGAAIAASGAGDAIQLVSARNFINNSGSASPLSAALGRFLVYSTDPASNALNGITSAFSVYSCTYGGACPSFAASGNGLLYSVAEVLASSPSSPDVLDPGSQIYTLYRGSRSDPNEDEAFVNWLFDTDEEEPSYGPPRKRAPRLGYRPHYRGLMQRLAQPVS